MTVLTSTKWHWAMRAALFLGTANATRLAVYDNFSFVLGLPMTLTIIVMMSLLAAYIGPLFRISWPASTLNMYWASTLTGVISATICLAVLAPFHLEGAVKFIDIVLSVISGAMSGAIILVIALMTKPLAMLSWAIGTLLIGYCARRHVYWLEEENGDIHGRSNTREHFSYSILPFRWWYRN